MRPIACVLLIALLAAADEWDVPKPQSNPRGKPMTLRLTLNRKKVHRAKVTTRWSFETPAGKRELHLELETEVGAKGRNAQGEITVEAPVTITRLVVQGEDLTEQVQPFAGSAAVTGRLDDSLHVKGGGTRGMDRLGNLRQLLLPLASWVLPYLPDQPVHVGEVWQVPPEYFLWNIRQGGRGDFEGHVSAVFEALEEREGVECARIRTVIGLRGAAGEAASRFKGEMVSFVGRDGYLRASRLRVRMQVTDAKTKGTVDWTMTRTVEAGPADPTPRKAKDWSGHMGDLPFVVGYEAGMKEAKFTGRPPMFVVTRASSARGAALGVTAWKDGIVLKNVASYTPVLIDMDVEAEAVAKFPTVADPAVLWVDLGGELIFMAQGSSPLDLFRISTGIARDRCPDVAPSPEYLALAKERDAMRAALEAGDVRTAVAKLLAIRRVGLGAYIQQEADRTDEDLTARGRKRLLIARALRKRGKEDAARAQIEAVAKDYAGHPVGKEAAELLDAR